MCFWEDVLVCHRADIWFPFVVSYSLGVCFTSFSFGIYYPCLVTSRRDWILSKKFKSITFLLNFFYIRMNVFGNVGGMLKKWSKNKKNVILA